MGAAVSAATIRTTPQVRRFDYDVTNTVNVSCIDDVRRATQQLVYEVWPQAGFDELWLAFHDFELLFEGRMPGYEGCDTVYHDIQHTLDMTLATARLLAGYEITANGEENSARTAPSSASSAPCFTMPVISATAVTRITATEPNSPAATSVAAVRGCVTICRASVLRSMQRGQPRSFTLPAMRKPSIKLRWRIRSTV